MKDDRKSDAGSSLPDRLFAAFEEADTESNAVVSEELTAFGVDTGQVVSDGLALVHSLLGQQKLLRAGDEFRRVRDAIAGLTQYATYRTQDIRDRIARGLAGEGNDRLVLIYHRKLESIEPEDLASLDDEKKLLQLIRQLKEADGE